MNDDLLERATAALRETTAEPERRAGLTRARLLESAHRRREGVRGAVVRWLVSLGAVLIAGTALARVAPHLPELLQAVLPSSSAQQAPAPARAARTRHAGSARKPANPRPAPLTPPPTVAPLLPQTAQPAVRSDVVAEAATPETAVEQQRPRGRRVSARRPHNTPTAPEPIAAPEPAAPARESAELALFRRAQRLHLAHDPAAVDAWDDYLRVSERGVLVPEARYNRALGLLRAGRRSEARAALEPFARGDYGDYRRAEARALLQALTGEAPDP